MPATSLFYAHAAMEALEEIDVRARIRLDELELSLSDGVGSRFPLRYSPCPMSTCEVRST